MIIKNFAAFAVILLTTRIEGRVIPRAIPSTIPSVSALPLKPEYDGYMSPEFSDVPMARNDSDSNEDDLLEEYLTDRLEDDFENETLSEQWPENDDNRSSSSIPDLTKWDDVDSNEDGHPQKSFTNPPTDENEDVSSSSLRPENDSLQESLTNSQKDENEDLTSSTPMSEKHIPIPNVDFTLEELEKMMAKLKEDRRILDAKELKLENDQPQESLTNPQKDENEEVTSSSPWPENDGKASRTVDDPTADEYYEYVDEGELEQFEQLERLEVKEFEKEVLDETTTNSQKDKTSMEQNPALVPGLCIGAAFLAFFVLGCLFNKCLDCKQGEGKSDNNPDSIDIEAQEDQDHKKIVIAQENLESAKNQVQGEMESIKNDTELPEKEKLKLLEDSQIVFNEIVLKETAMQKLSSNNLKKAKSSGYGRQSTNNVSIESVALAALKLEAERSSDNVEEGEGGNAEAVGPSDNCSSLPRMRPGSAIQLSNVKKLSKMYSVESGIGDSPSDSLRSISSSRPTSPPIVGNDEAFCEDEKSTNSSFVRGGMRRSISNPNVSKGNNSLQRAAIRRDRNQRSGDRLDKTQSVYYQNARQITVLKETYEMTPEMPRRQSQVAFSNNQI